MWVRKRSPPQRRQPGDSGRRGPSPCGWPVRPRPRRPEPVWPAHSHVLGAAHQSQQSVAADVRKRGSFEKTGTPPTSFSRGPRVPPPGSFRAFLRAQGGIPSPSPTYPGVSPQDPQAPGGSPWLQGTAPPLGGRSRDTWLESPPGMQRPTAVSPAGRGEEVTLPPPGHRGSACPHRLEGPHWKAPQCWA